MGAVHRVGMQQRMSCKAQTGSERCQGPGEGAPAPPASPARPGGRRASRRCAGRGGSCCARWGCPPPAAAPPAPAAPAHPCRAASTCEGGRYALCSKIVQCSAVVLPRPASSWQLPATMRGTALPPTPVFRASWGDAHRSQTWMRLGKRPQGTVYEKGRSSQATSRKRPSGEGANELYSRGAPTRLTSPELTCPGANECIEGRMVRVQHACWNAAHQPDCGVSAMVSGLTNFTRVLKCYVRRCKCADTCFAGIHASTNCRPTYTIRIRGRTETRTSSDVM